MQSNPFGTIYGQHCLHLYVGAPVVTGGVRHSSAEFKLPSHMPGNHRTPIHYIKSIQLAKHGVAFIVKKRQEMQCI